MKELKQLQEKRGHLYKQLTDIRDLARKESRSLTSKENETFDSLATQIEELDASIAREVRAIGLESNKVRELSKQEERDLQKVSIGRILRHQAGMGEFAGNRTLDGIELEVINEGAKEAREMLAGGALRGVYIPSFVARRSNPAEKRTMSATGQTSTAGDQGGMTVATSPLGLVDAFFDSQVLTALGVTDLLDLKGNLRLPRLVRGTKPGHKPETGAADGYDPLTAQLSLSPKRLPTWVNVAEQLLVQSDQPILQAINLLLTNELSQEMQFQLLHGGGGSNTPVGVNGTSGISVVFAGGAASNATNADGAAPVWKDMVNLKRAVAALNANTDRSNFLFNEATVGALEFTPRVASTGDAFIIDDRFGRRILGKEPAVSNSVRSDLTKGSGTGLSAGFYGHWPDLIRAMWTGINLEVTRDTTDAKNGEYCLHAAVYYDGGVIRPQSFAVCRDFATA